MYFGFGNLIGKQSNSGKHSYTQLLVVFNEQGPSLA
jgi:hypothetical protein